MNKRKEFTGQGQGLRGCSLQRFRCWADIYHAPPNLALLSTYWKHEGMRDQQHPGSLWRKIQIASSSTTLPLSLRESCFATDYATYSLRGFRVVGISCRPVAAWVEGFKQMGFEVTAKTTPVQHSSLQIEVVTYESGKLGKCCMKCLHCQFWRRDPIEDSTSAKGRSSYGWYSTISVAPRMEGWLWLLVTVARLHRLWSVHLRPKDSARDSVNKKEACSLQMVIMLKRRVAMVFARPSVHTSKANMVGACKVWVGVVSLIAIVWMLPRVQILQVQLPLWTWIEVAFGGAQVKQLKEDLAQP